VNVITTVCNFGFRDQNHAFPRLQSLMTQGKARSSQRYGQRSGK